MVKYETIDEYISNFPTEVREILVQIREIIHRSAPGATEVISYGVPAFDLGGKHLVFFAAYDKHISIYPRSESAESVIAELGKHTKGRGTYQFPLDEPIPYDLIEQLLPFMIADRMAQK